MDFIWKLLSFSRFNTILVIIDQLTKQTIFISAHNTITSVNLACFFILYIFSKHSVSSYVISDRSLEFMSNISYSLDTALNMQLYFTLDYYPEDNGQTEFTNQTLK